MTLLQELQSLIDAQPLGSSAFATLQRAKEELERQHGRPVVRWKRVGSHNLPLPAYATEGAVGLDLRASQPFTILPGARSLVTTGFAAAIPDGYEGQVRPRSGLAWERGVTVLNTPGTIDPDYSGEIKVILVNLGNETFEIQKGDRVAQLVITPAVRATGEEVDDLPRTARGANGVGSTGVK